MIGDLLNNNKRKDVVTREGQLFFKGKKYSVEKSTGYYVSTTDKKRLHVAMWEDVNGPVPDGYIIHHIDWNKTHNYIENLTCVTQEEHNLIHNRPSDLSKLTSEQKKILNNLKSRGLI